MRLIALVIAAAALAWPNACVTTATGTAFSSAAHWTSCGGTTPQNGDSWSIQHNTVLDTDVGSVAGGGTLWGQVLCAACTFSTDGLAPHTITFGSTGSLPWGTGTKTAPDNASATMHGIRVDRGTLDFRAATATNWVKITVADPTFFTYVSHVWTRAGSYASVTHFKYTAFENLGANVDGAYGLHVEANGVANTLSVDHCLFTSPYRAMNLTGFSSDDTFGGATFNTITGRRGEYTININTVLNPVFSDNTEHSPAANGHFIYGNVRPSGMSFLRNAITGTGAYYLHGLEFANATTPALATTIQDNLWQGQTVTTGVFFTGTSGAAGVPWLIDRNTVLDAREGVITTGTVALPITVTNNVVSQAVQVSGGTSPFNIYAGPVTLTGNVGYGKPGTVGIGVFCHSTTPGIASVQMNRNTILSMPNDPGETMRLIRIAKDSPTEVCTGVVVKNNIATGGNQGIGDGETTNTWVQDYNGVGCHHNNVWDVDPPYFKYLTGSPNFDNGTDLHPNAIYGDVSIAPGYVNTERSLATYDAYVGGPGTLPNVFAELAKRCGLLGAYNPDYNVPAIYHYIRMGFAPTETRLATLADDESYIGAVRPIGVIGAF